MDVGVFFTYMCRYDGGERKAALVRHRGVWLCGKAMWHGAWNILPLFSFFSSQVITGCREQKESLSEGRVSEPRFFPTKMW